MVTKESMLIRLRKAFDIAKPIGIAGFGTGFIGPFFLHPTSNQGPLFGIIISGPLSFVCGMFMGFVSTYFVRVRYDLVQFIGGITCVAATAAYLVVTK